MDSKLFIFIAACFSSLFWTALPSLYVTAFLCIFAVLFFFNAKTQSFASLLIGLSWMASLGHWQYSMQLPLVQIERTILVQGEIQSLSHLPVGQAERFNLRVNQAAGETLHFSRLVRVSWTHSAWALKQGQKVQLLLKLKPPHGLANEGGFNYQQWLFSERISATGYVKVSPENKLLKQQQTYRQTLLDKLVALKLPYQAWIAALGIGYRGMLDSTDWTLVQASGIAHLIAISGLHLAMVASLSFMLVLAILGAVLSRFSFAHGINLHRFAVVLTLATTYFYALIAGMSLPTIRAWLMLLLVSSLFLLNINWGLKRLIVACCCGLLMLFPFSLFGLSFWLSLSAIVAIAFIFWRWPLNITNNNLVTHLKLMLRIQLMLSVLMLPLIAWQFSLVSWQSPLINLLAVPIVTFILLPVCLIGVIGLSLSFAPANALFYLLDHLIGFLLYLLNEATALNWATSSVAAAPYGIWLLAILAMVLIVVPPLGCSKVFASLLFLPLLSYALVSKNTDWTVDFLDVGQGTSVLISRFNKVIIYDVGAAYPSGFNMAESVILPLLTSRGIHQLDKVIISHWDNDHSGSLAVLSQNMLIHELITTAEQCRLGSHFEWQGLAFEIFWPNQGDYSDNNGSCVVRVSDGAHAVLLTGDIDKSIEQKLIARWGDNLQSDILLAAHHGSNGSSDTSFIQLVNAQFVVFSQGFMNRWRFPRPEVVKRFNQTQAELYKTSEHGQIQFRFNYGSHHPIKVKTFRQDIYPRWYANFPQG